MNAKQKSIESSNEKKNSIEIDIKQGFTCFETGLKHDFEVNKLHVITGLNGSGKTQLLKYIASLCVKSKNYAKDYNKNNVVLKINTKTEITEERYRRDRWEYDRDTVDDLIKDILDALNRYENIELEYKQDLYNALFDSANYLFRYRTDVIELFCKRIEQKYNIAKDELQKAFGVVTDSEVNKYFEDKYTEEFKAENGKERVKGKENKKN